MILVKNGGRVIFLVLLLNMKKFIYLILILTIQAAVLKRISDK